MSVNACFQQLTSKAAPLGGELGWKALPLGRAADENPSRFGLYIQCASHHRAVLSHSTSVVELFRRERQSVARADGCWLPCLSPNVTLSRRCLSRDYLHRVDCCMDGLCEACSLSLGCDVRHCVVLGIPPLHSATCFSAGSREHCPHVL